jgi:hypothetical protein
MRQPIRTNTVTQAWSPRREDAKIHRNENRERSLSDHARHPSSGGGRLSYFELEIWCGRGLPTHRDLALVWLVSVKVGTADRGDLSGMGFSPGFSGLRGPGLTWHQTFRERPFMADS